MLTYSTYATQKYIDIKIRSIWGNRENDIVGVGWANKNSKPSFYAKSEPSYIKLLNICTVVGRKCF